MRNLRNSKGFTLIELMIVVVIIGILAAIAIPKFTAVTAKSKQAEAGPILKQICTMAQAYYQENTAAPTMSNLFTAGLDSTTVNGSKYFDFNYASGNATAAPKSSLATGHGLVGDTLTCLSS